MTLRLLTINGPAYQRHEYHSYSRPNCVRDADRNGAEGQREKVEGSAVPGYNDDGWQDPGKTVRRLEGRRRKYLRDDCYRELEPVQAKHLTCCRHFGL